MGLPDGLKLNTSYLAPPKGSGNLSPMLRRLRISTATVHTRKKSRSPPNIKVSGDEPSP